METSTTGTSAPLLDDADGDADNGLFTDHMECLIGIDQPYPANAFIDILPVLVFG